MSFTDGKPFVVTEEQTKLHWGSGFNCKLCGMQFAAGETARWIYANSTPGQGTGNFFVCQKCDKSDAEVMAEAKESLRKAIRGAKIWGIYGPDWEREHRA